MPSHSSTSTKGRNRTRPLAVGSSLAAVLIFASQVAGHDFWLIPHLFAFANDSVVDVDGKSGVRFPEGTAVQPTRIESAWLIGSANRTRITGMTVEDNSLRLRQKPEASGQYLIAVGLTPRATRSTPTGLLRFLRAEGGASEADRLEREKTLSGDSLVFHSASFAATVVQVGRAGSQAFSSTAGFGLEFVPLNDPTQLHLGDTLHVRLVGGGKPVAGIGVDARSAADTVGSANPWTTLTADGNGVAHVALGKAGPWLLRSARVAKRTGSSGEWDVARTTYVFGVAARR